MAFQNQTKISFLIPDMNAAIGAASVANTIFVEGGTNEFRLLELLSKYSIFEKLFARVSWVPELNRTGCDGHKSQIILLFRPLNIGHCICTCRHLHQDLLSLHVEYGHVVLVTSINCGNIALARTD